MKISERVALLRAGYSRDEISAMIEEDKAAEERPAEENNEEVAEPTAEQKEVTPSESYMFPEWASGLIKSVDELRKSIEASNRAAIEQPEEVSSWDKATAAIISAYNGNKKQEV